MSKIKEVKTNNQGLALMEFIVLLLVVAIVGIAIYVYLQNQSVSPTVTPRSSNLPTSSQLEEVPLPTLSKEDTTSAIDEELNAVDLGNLDKEFDEIERDLEQL